MAQMFMPAKWETKYETLKTEEKTWEDLDEEDSYVKIGDPVVQVLEGTDALEKSEQSPLSKPTWLRRNQKNSPTEAAAPSSARCRRGRRCDGSRKHDRADVPHARRHDDGGRVVSRPTPDTVCSPLAPAEARRTDRPLGFFSHADIGLARGSASLRTPHKG